MTGHGGKQGSRAAGLAGALTAYWPVMAVTLAGLVIRLLVASREGMWWDEWSTIAYSRMSMGEFFYHFRRFESHPPLFFMIQRLIFAFFGESLLTVRIFPVIAGAACISAVYALGRKYRERSGPLLAAWILALHPFHVQWSASGRMYSPVSLLGILSVLYLPLGSGPAFWKYVFVCTVMMYSHYYGILILLGHVLWGLWGLYFRMITRRGFMRIIQAQVIVGICFLPWVLYANILPFHSDFEHCITTWLPKADVAQFVDSISGLLMDMPLIFNRFSGIVFATLMLFVLGSGFVRIREPARSQLLFFSFTMPAGLFVVSAITGTFLGAHVFQVLQTVIVAPVFAVMIGFSIDKLLAHRGNAVIVLAACFLAFAAVPGLSSRGRIPLREILQKKMNVKSADDLVVVAPFVIAHMLEFVSGREFMNIREASEILKETGEAGNAETAASGLVLLFRENPHGDLTDQEGEEFLELIDEMGFRLKEKRYVGYSLPWTIRRFEISEAVTSRQERDDVGRLLMRVRRINPALMEWWSPVMELYDVVPEQGMAEAVHSAKLVKNGNYIEAAIDNIELNRIWYWKLSFYPFGQIWEYINRGRYRGSFTSPATESEESWIIEFEPDMDNIPPVRIMYPLGWNLLLLLLLWHNRKGIPGKILTIKERISTQ